MIKIVFKFSFGYQKTDNPWGGLTYLISISSNLVQKQKKKEKKQYTHLKRPLLKIIDFIIRTLLYFK